MKLNSHIDKGTAIIVAIMTVIVMIVLGISWQYYGNINESEDPRVLSAKVLYSNYDALAVDKKYDSIFLLLFEMENIYSQYSDYKNSYEIGVICNNRAATLITIALFETKDSLQQDSLFNEARINIERSISIYKNWMEEFAQMEESEIRNHFSPIYYKGHSLFKEKEIEHYIKKRIKDIQLAQKEMPRRLSVSYTNFGMVHRYQNETVLAIKNYKLALSLWENNLTAENNINAILGLPLKKRGVLDRLFPPEK